MSCLPTEQSGAEQTCPASFLFTLNHSILGMPGTPQALCHNLSHLRIFLL